MLVGEGSMAHERSSNYESQEELRASVGSIFSDSYPVWECPDCGWLNRNPHTFYEFCGNCGKDYTLTWNEYVLKVSDAGIRGAKAGTELKEALKAAIKDVAKPLDIKYELPPVDIVTINGVRYTGEFFRLFAFPNPDFVYSFERFGEDGAVMIHRHGTKKELGLC